VCSIGCGRLYSLAVTFSKRSMYTCVDMLVSCACELTKNLVCLDQARSATYWTVGGKVIRALRFARTIFRPVADTGTASGIIKYIEKIQHLSKTHLLSLIKSK